MLFPRRRTLRRVAVCAADVFDDFIGLAFQRRRKGRRGSPPSFSLPSSDRSGVWVGLEPTTTVRDWLTGGLGGRGGRDYGVWRTNGGRVIDVVLQYEVHREAVGPPLPSGEVINHNNDQYCEWIISLSQFSQQPLLLIRCMIRPSSLNVLGGTWKRISLPDIKDMSALEVLPFLTVSRNCVNRPTNRRLLTYLLHGQLKAFTTRGWTIR